jgi:hypothetical protein
MTAYKANPSVVCTEVEDSMVLLHLDTKRYFTLNGTGVAIWRGLASGKNEEEIVAGLLEEYDASQERLAESARRLLDKLEKADLIIRQ